MGKKNLPSFREPRLVKGVSRWYILIYADLKNGKRLKEKKLTFDLNRILHLHKREERGLQIVKRLNFWLNQGYWFEDFNERESILLMREKEAMKEEPEQEVIGLIEAIELTRDEKISEHSEKRLTVTSYESHARLFINYLREKELDKLMLHEFVERYAMNYMRYWVQERNITNNNTYNNKLRNISTFFNYLVDVKKYIKKNPFKGIKYRKKQEARKAVLTIEEANTLSNLCREYDPWLWVAIQMAFWGSVRQEEMSRLKIGFFRFKPFYIAWPEGTTKNQRSYNSTLPNFLVKEFKEIGVFDARANQYIIGYGCKPNEREIHHKTLNTRNTRLKKHAEKLELFESRDGLGFSSWRLTGGNFFADILTPKEVKDWFHHANFATTEHYLRSHEQIKPIINLDWHGLTEKFRE